MARIAHNLMLMGISLLFGVVLVDLIFDYGGLPTETSYHYYKGHRTAKLPWSAAIPAGILTVVIGLGMKVMKRAAALDFIFFGLFAACLYIFLAFLLPDQEILAKLSPQDPKVVELLRNIAKWHLVMLPMVAGGILLLFADDQTKPAQNVKRA